MLPLTCVNDEAIGLMLLVWQLMDTGPISSSNKHESHFSIAY